MQLVLVQCGSLDQHYVTKACFIQSVLSCMLLMLLQKKEVPKKSYEDKGTSLIDEEPLDDPLEEKLRQQRYGVILYYPSKLA